MQPSDGIPRPTRKGAARIAWISAALVLGAARGFAAPPPDAAEPPAQAPAANPPAQASAVTATSAPKPAMNAPALAPAVTQSAPPPTVTATPAPIPMTQGTLTPLNLEAGNGRLIALHGNAANIFVADPHVAEVRPASASSLFLFGLAVGHTTVAALDADGKVLAQYDVSVQPQSYGAHQAQAMIARLIPDSHVKVQAQAKGFLLTGSVNTPQDAAQAVAIAKGFATENQAIDNEVVVTTPLQVTLKVRIAEMSRTVVRNLGVNWQAIGAVGTIGKLPALALNVNASTVTCAAAQGSSNPICPGVNFNGIIDALAEDNLAHILAEPNLTVKSGQPASFQVGGEFPIPVNETNGAISVTYKSYGIMLSFLPTVLSDGRIDIHVKPEVSALDKQNGVTLNAGNAALVIPGISVRRAESSVELGSGESFAIAGLLQTNIQDNSSALPGLGETPLLGALFRDTGLQKQETELVIVVTPYLVRPVSDPARLRFPTDDYRTPSELDRLLLLKQVAKNEPSVPVRIPGSAGFIVE